LEQQHYKNTAEFENSEASILFCLLK